jgi:hypothetical protein
LEREAWPRNSEIPFTNCRSSRPTFSRNIAFTSRSIRGLGPLAVCSRRCGASSYVNEDGKRRKLGSRITACRTGGNFLTPEIARTARREAAYREIGALIDAERLAEPPPVTVDLLESMGRQALLLGLHERRKAEIDALKVATNALEGCRCPESLKVSYHGP